ncbi:unnamed protein product [Amoebophrya sp. A25]|nr:unnamed protein product [Amoebophrya sp. A25]|eukprot:GSA25T00017899001.1
MMKDPATPSSPSARRHQIKHFSSSMLQHHKNDDDDHVVVAYPAFLHFQNAAQRILSPEQLDSVGFRAGQNLARYLLRKKVISEHRDALKFLCREIWSFCFGKQADRLQANRDTGGFVIHDNQFRPVLHGANSVHLWCGLIRGSITWLRAEFALGNVDTEVFVRAERNTAVGAVFYLDFLTTTSVVTRVVEPPEQPAVVGNNAASDASVVSQQDAHDRALGEQGD